MFLEEESTSSSIKADNDSDTDELPQFDFSALVKVENKRARPRPHLAQQPILEGIPEERGHGAKREVQGEHGTKRKPRKTPPNIFPEETIQEEPVEPDCDSPKTDERETGYGSQGSDFWSTPKDLSCEDLSELDYDVKSEDHKNSVRSHSDPIPTGLSEGETQLIDSTINSHGKTLTSSNSDPNLSNNLKPALSSTTPIKNTDKIRAASVTSNEEAPTTPVTPHSDTPPTTPTELKEPPPLTKRKTPKAVRFVFISATVS